MKRERKELAVGEHRQEAIVNFELDGRTFDEGRHEVVQDAQTTLWSVYNKRKKSDRTIKRPITRVAREPYSNGYGRDRRPVVVTLHPRELIETRLKGTRRRYTITWDDLHHYLVRRHALQVMSAKIAARRARKKARRAK